MHLLKATAFSLDIKVEHKQLNNLQSIGEDELH